MKFQAQIGDELHSVELQRDRRRVLASVDGRQYELECSSPEPETYLLRHNGRVHEFYVLPGVEGDAAVVTVSSTGGDLDIRLIDPKRLRGSAGDAAAGLGVAELKTMMPGKVVKIVAALGDVVKKGDAVMVVEAMKMQNDLKAPKDGVVADIRVSEGSTVTAGDILAVIE